MSGSDESSESDAVLIARAKRGDAQAYGKLYKRYVDAMYRYIRTRVSDEHTAQDLTEVVFLRAYESLGRYRERGLKFSAYLYQVARHLIVDHYRSAQDDLGLSDAESRPGGGQGMDERFIEREQLGLVARALKRLPEDYQEVIRLRVILEVPTGEAAEWMKRSPGAVRVLLHRAMNALRREIEREDETG